MRGCTAGRFKETKGLAGGQRNGNGRPRRGDNESRACQNENLLPGRSCKQLLSEASVLPRRNVRRSSGDTTGVSVRGDAAAEHKDYTRSCNPPAGLVNNTDLFLSFFFFFKVSCLQKAAEIRCGRKNREDAERDLGNEKEKGNKCEDAS